MREPEPAPDDGTTGVVGRARAFLAACAQYASARVRLASLEGREAAAHGFKLLLLAGAAIILAAFGWLFVCLAAVFLLAKALGGESPWVWAALMMAALHLAGIVVLGLIMKSKLRKSLFPMTTGELKKDQEWLDQQTRKNTQS
jgi:uncharacterized membrane protein YqjE